MTLSGYIFLNAQGEYLTHQLVWYKHAKPEDAFVHAEKVSDMAKNAENWKSKLTHFIPASWDGKKVTVTGCKQAIK